MAGFAPASWANVPGKLAYFIYACFSFCSCIAFSVSFCCSFISSFCASMDISCMERVKSTKRFLIDKSAPRWFVFCCFNRVSWDCFYFICEIDFCFDYSLNMMASLNCYIRSCSMLKLSSHSLCLNSPSSLFRSRYSRNTFLVISTLEECDLCLLKIFEFFKFI
jgi:hypothetical protein